jgi:hypothetical protein
MDRKMQLTLALMQVENIRELLKDGPYAGFFTSHLLPIKFEIERQQTLLTNTKHSSTIKE